VGTTVYLCCIVAERFFCMTFSTKNLNFCAVPLFAKKTPAVNSL